MLVALSCTQSTPCAPNAAGIFVRPAYDPAATTGTMERITFVGQPGEADQLDEYLGAKLAGRKIRGPIVALVHGFDYDPRDHGSDNPHMQLFHFREVAEETAELSHSASWPLGLGFEPGDDGLCLPFGWLSFAGTPLRSLAPNPYPRCYQYATESALVLMHWLDAVRRRAPGVPIDIVGHSLGSRLVLSMVQHAISKGRNELLHALGRIVLMGGAEHSCEADRILDNLRRAVGGAPAGPRFFNIATRADAVLQYLATTFGPRNGEPVIGRDGLADSADEHADRWRDFHLDDPNCIAELAAKGFRVVPDAPGDMLDHWHYYTIPANFAVVRSILRNRELW